MKKILAACVGFVGLALVLVAAGTPVNVPGIPAGAIMEFAGPTCPTGWLVANGGDPTNGVATATYPALYAAIGNNWDTAKRNDGTAAFWTAPGAGKFRTPDLRGVFRRGAGTSTDSANANSVTVSLYGASGAGFKDSKTAKNGLGVTTNTDGTHSHNYTDATLGTTPATLAGGSTYKIYDVAMTTGTTGSGHNHTLTVAGDTETAPRSVGVTVCIKY